MLLSKILKNIDYKGEIVRDEEINDIIYDSRKASDNTIFVCISGVNIDGHKFAKSAYENGSRVFICEKEIDVPDDAQVFIVENSRKVLRKISENFFDNPAKDLKIIGITGTKGKTTTAHVVQCVLNGCDVPCGIIGTVGAEFKGKKYPTVNTTPESYELQKLFRSMLDDGCRAVALEVSSLGLKQGRVDGINFFCAIFSNLSPDHIGPREHETMEEYAYWKSVLFERCDNAVINFDDEAHSIMTENCKCKVMSFGFKSEYDLYAENLQDIIVNKKTCISFDCNIMGQRTNVVAPMRGDFNVYNVLSALGVAVSLGCSIDKAIESLKNVKVRGRFEVVDIDADFQVIIDYAHNGYSLKSILDTVNSYKTNRVICVFGSVGGRTKDRRREMGIVAGSMCDLCVVTSDNPDFEDPMNIINDIVSAINEVNGKYYTEPDRKKAIEYALSVAEDGDIILLTGKGHEEYQLINGVKEPFSEIDCINEYMRRHKND